MDMHLDMLSKKHLETKFARIDAEKSPFLTERLKIWMLPTLALISKEKVLDYIVGFDDLGGTDDFPTEHLRLVLASKNALNYEGGDDDADANPRGAEEGDGGAGGEEEPAKGRGQPRARERRRGFRFQRLRLSRVYHTKISYRRRARQSEHRNLKTRRVSVDDDARSVAPRSLQTQNLVPLVRFASATRPITSSRGNAPWSPSA